MKVLKFKIPIYGQSVTLVQVESKDDAKPIVPILKDIKLSQENFDDVIDCVQRGCFNGGDTFRNFQLEKILVVFYILKTPKVKANIYSHEKRHIEDRVLEWANVHDIEASAFLAGFLGEKFYEFTNITSK